MANDKFKIDSHKLIYHIPRVNDWLNGKDIYPIYMEVSPCGACNHRCSFCAVDYLEYQNRRLDTDIFYQRLKEMGHLGLKSIMYAGEGEPFLHPDMAAITSKTRAAGIDVAFTTNAVLFKESLQDEVLANSQWIKVSINAGTDKTYSQIHRTKPADFEKVIENMSRAAQLRQMHQYQCALGMQILLLPENDHEICTLAQLASDIGMDYLVVKPYSQNPQSKTNQYDSVRYDHYARLAEELENFNSDSFSVIFRANAMNRWDDGHKPYHRCLALPFWSYLDAGGNIWGCSMYMGDDRFNYGNIYEQTFAQIWHGDKRRESLRFVAEALDAGSCRLNCRMDAINRYLWQLKDPPAHSNFI